MYHSTFWNSARSLKGCAERLVSVVGALILIRAKKVLSADKKKADDVGEGSKETSPHQEYIEPLSSSPATFMESLRTFNEEFKNPGGVTVDVPEFQRRLLSYSSAIIRLTSDCDKFFMTLPPNSDPFTPIRDIRLGKVSKDTPKNMLKLKTIAEEHFLEFCYLFSKANALFARCGRESIDCHKILERPDFTVNLSDFSGNWLDAASGLYGKVVVFSRRAGNAVDELNQKLDRDVIQRKANNAFTLKLTMTTLKAPEAVNHQRTQFPFFDEEERHIPTYLRVQDHLWQAVRK